MKTDRRTPRTYLAVVARHAHRTGQGREEFLAQFKPSVRASAAQHYDAEDAKSGGAEAQLAAARRLIAESREIAARNRELLAELMKDAEA